jgi:hypothetical protein
MKTIELIETGPETTTETIDGETVERPVVTVIHSEDVPDEEAGRTLHRYRLQAQLQNRDEGTDVYSARIQPEPEE